MTQLRQSMDYEAFMKRALSLDNRIRRPVNQEYLNLVREEKARNQKEINKELSYLKQRLQKAIEIFEKHTINPADKVGLVALMPLIEIAKSSDDINKIVEKGLQLTIPFKGG